MSYSFSRKVDAFMGLPLSECNTSGFGWWPDASVGAPAGAPVVLLTCRAQQPVHGGLRGQEAALIQLVGDNKRRRAASIMRVVAQCQHRLLLRRRELVSGLETCRRRPAVGLNLAVPVLELAFKLLDPLALGLAGFPLTLILLLSAGIGYYLGKDEIAHTKQNQGNQ